MAQEQERERGQGEQLETKRAAEEQHEQHRTDADAGCDGDSPAATTAAVPGAEQGDENAAATPTTRTGDAAGSAQVDDDQDEVAERDYANAADVDDDVQTAKRITSTNDLSASTSDSAPAPAPSPAPAPHSSPPRSKLHKRKSSALGTLGHGRQQQHKQVNNSAVNGDKNGSNVSIATARFASTDSAAAGMGRSASMRSAAPSSIASVAGGAGGGGRLAYRAPFKRAGAGRQQMGKGQQWATILDAARRAAVFDTKAVLVADKRHPTFSATAASPRPVQSGASSGGHEADWPEVLRKFQKHNANRKVYLAAAKADQVVHLAMARAAKAAQYDGGVSAARAQFAKVDLAMLRRGGGGGNDADVLAQRVRSRFATPLVVDGSNDGADEGDAPGAFAPFVVGGGGAEASNKSDVGQLASALDALDDALAKDDKAQAGSATERASARVVRAHVLYALGKMDDALKALERDQHDDDEHDAAWATCEMVDDDDEGRDDLLATYEPYDLVLRVVGNALKGLCLERLGKDDKLAVDAFRRAASLYEFVVGLVSSNGERDVPDVELDTWGELAMFRLAYLARKTKDVPLIFASHKLWLPASSALGKRLASNRARTEAHDERAMIVHDSYRSVLNFVGPRALERSVWRQETRANDDAHEARVRRATAIPRAGETNARYLAFLDDVAQSWRVGGLARDDAHHVARVMRDAQTHTFNSHTLVRHLARAEAALGAYDDARDLLALYRDLWQKTRETELKDVNAFLRAYRRRTEPDATKPRALSESKARESADPEKAGDEGTGDEAAAREAAQAHDGVLDDIDTERDFVQTMCFATRLCVRKLDEPATAREFADAALAVVKPDDDDRLKAAVERAQGLAKAAYAASLDGFVEDVEQRPELQTQALEHLAAAARLEPDVWENKFQLAYLLAELRDDMPAALAAAREAQDSRGGLEVAHLVALLMTAGADRQGKQAALGVLDDALARERSFVDNARGTLSAAGSRFLTTPNESTLNLANGSGGASRKPSVSPSSIRGLDVLSDDLRRKLAKMQLDRHTAGPSTPPMVPDITLDDGSLDADELSGDRDGFARDDVDVLASRLSVRLTRIQIAEAVHGPFVAAKEHDALGRWLEAELERLPLDDDDAGSTHTSTTSPPSPASTVAGSGGGRAPSKLQRPRSRPDLRGSSSSRPSSIVGVPAPTQTQHQQQQQKHSSLLHVPHLHRHRTLSRSGGGGGGGGGGGAPGATAPSSPLAGSPTSDAALSPDEREPSSRRGGQDGFEVVQSARVRKLIQLDAHELARSYDVRLARDVRTMLMSQRLAKAATLRRAGKMDEARDAIAEAERVDEHHADVWAQFAIWCFASEDTESARVCLSKSLIADERHLGAQVLLARHYLDAQVLADAHLAEAILEPLTKGQGWSSAEAWLELARAYERTGRRRDEREALVYALRMERSRTLRPLGWAMSRAL